MLNEILEEYYLTGVRCTGYQCSTNCPIHTGTEIKLPDGTSTRCLINFNLYIRKNILGTENVRNMVGMEEFIDRTRYMLTLAAMNNDTGTKTFAKLCPSRCSDNNCMQMKIVALFKPNEKRCVEPFLEMYNRWSICYE